MLNGKKIKVAVFTAMVACLAATAARADDGGAWLSVQANKGWKDTYAFARLEYRANNHFQSTDAWFLAAGGGYAFAPWLKADLSYEFWRVSNEMSVHKAVLSGAATMVRDGLAVSIREKLEFAVTPSASATSLTLRSRLRAQYSIPGSIFRPYAMAEIFNWSSWIRSLYYAGVEMSIDKHNMFDLYYLYHLPNGGPAVHLLGVGYFFNF